MAAASKGLPAPAKCVEAVAAAVSRPFEEGLRVEREAFLHLVQTSESKALRHAFFAERTAAKIPDVPDDTPTRTIRAAAVIGAGTMGGGIAMNFANAGIPVTVLEVTAQALEKGLAVIRKNYEGNVKKGRITAAQLEERMGLIRPTTSYADIAPGRHRRRGGVRGHGGEGEGVPTARRGDEAGRDPRHQHLDARREPDRALHRGGRRTSSGPTSSARPT